MSEITKSNPPKKIHHHTKATKEVTQSTTSSSERKKMERAFNVSSNTQAILSINESHSSSTTTTVTRTSRTTTVVTMTIDFKLLGTIFFLLTRTRYDFSAIVTGSPPDGSGTVSHLKKILKRVEAIGTKPDLLTSFVQRFGPELLCVPLDIAELQFARAKEATRVETLYNQICDELQGYIALTRTGQTIKPRRPREMAQDAQEATREALAHIPLSKNYQTSISETKKLLMEIDKLMTECLAVEDEYIYLSKAKAITRFDRDIAEYIPIAAVVDRETKGHLGPTLSTIMQNIEELSCFVRRFPDDAYQLTDLSLAINQSIINLEELFNSAKTASTKMMTELKFVKVAETRLQTHMSSFNAKFIVEEQIGIIDKQLIDLQKDLEPHYPFFLQHKLFHQEQDSREQILRTRYYLHHLTSEVVMVSESEKGKKRIHHETIHHSSNFSELLVFIQPADKILPDDEIEYIERDIDLLIPPLPETIKAPPLGDTAAETAPGVIDRLGQIETEMGKLKPTPFKLYDFMSKNVEELTQLSSVVVGLAATDAEQYGPLKERYATIAKSFQSGSTTLRVQAIRQQKYQTPSYLLIKAKYQCEKLNEEVYFAEQYQFFKKLSDKYDEDKIIEAKPQFEEIIKQLDDTAAERNPKIPFYLTRKQSLKRIVIQLVEFTSLFDNLECTPLNTMKHLSTAEQEMQVLIDELSLSQTTSNSKTVGVMMTKKLAMSECRELITRTVLTNEFKQEMTSEILLLRKDVDFLPQLLFQSHVKNEGKVLIESLSIARYSLAHVEVEQNRQSRVLYLIKTTKTTILEVTQESVKSCSLPSTSDDTKKRHANAQERLQKATQLVDQFYEAYSVSDKSEEERFNDGVLLIQTAIDTEPVYTLRVILKTESSVKLYQSYNALISTLLGVSYTHVFGAQREQLPKYMEPFPDCADRSVDLSSDAAPDAKPRQGILVNPDHFNPSGPRVSFDFTKEEEVKAVISELVPSQQPAPPPDESEESSASPTASAAVVPTTPEQLQDLMPTPVPESVFESWHLQKFTESVRPPMNVPSLDVTEIAQQSKVAVLRNRLIGRGLKTNAAPTFTTGYASFNHLKLKPLHPEHDYDESATKEDVERQIPEKLAQLRELHGQFMKAKANSQEDSNFAERTILIASSAALLDQIQVTVGNAKHFDLFPEETQEMVTMYMELDTDISVLIKNLNNRYVQTPREAVGHSTLMLIFIKSVLDHSVEHMTDPAQERAKTNAMAWIRYLKECIDVYRQVEMPDDNVVIVAFRQLFLNTRSALASFAVHAQELDKLHGHTLLGTAQKMLLHSLENLNGFLKRVEVTELITAPQMTIQLEALYDAFDKFDAEIDAKFQTFKENASKTLKADQTIQTNDADRLNEELRQITNLMEKIITQPNRHPEFDKISDLFIKATSARFSLVHLHVSDSDPDARLCSLIETNNKDFMAVGAKMMHASSGSPQQPAAVAWNEQCTRAVANLQVLKTVSDVMPSNIYRYQEASQYLLTLTRYIFVLESKLTIFSIKDEYQKLSTSLQQTLDYLSDESSPRREDLTQRKHMSVLAFKNLDLKDAIAIDETEDIDFSTYSQGFVPRAKALTIAAQNVNIQTFSYLQDLVIAHINTLSRNYSISKRSTNLCFEIIQEICSSLLDVIALIPRAVESRDHALIKESVSKHVANLDAIQPSFTDSPAFSHFARQRLIAFLEMCNALGQITTLNAHNLDDEQEGDFEVMSFNQVFRTLFTQLSTFQKYDVSPMITATEVVVKASRTDPGDTVSIIFILENETALLRQISAISQQMMSEADVEIFTLTEDEIKQLETAERSVMLDEKDDGTYSATDIKGLLGQVHDNLRVYQSFLEVHHYQSTEFIQISTEVATQIRNYSKQALSLDGCDEEFRRNVYYFKQTYSSLLKVFIKEARIGTQKLYSYEAQQIIGEIRQPIMKMLQALAVREQIYERGVSQEVVGESTILDRLFSMLTRYAKLLLMARDSINLVNVQEVHVAGHAYDIVAQILLQIKNTNRIKLKAAQIDSTVLQPLVFSVQELLDSADFLLIETKTLEKERSEAPLYLLQAAWEPVVRSLAKVKAEINPAMPNGAGMRKKVSRAHSYCQLNTTHFYQE